MLSKAITYIKSNILFVLYTLILLLLLPGLYHGSGTKHFFKFSIYLISFIVAFIAIEKLLRDKLSVQLRKVSFQEKYFPLISRIILVFILVFISIHFIFLQHIPLYTAYLSLDYYGIAHIRQSIMEHDSTLIKYISSFLYKAILPFFLVFFFKKDKVSFYILLVFSVIYTLGLMQKSLIVSILIPLIIYCVLSKKIIYALSFTALCTAGVFILVFVTNPQLRANKAEIAQYMKEHKGYKDDLGNVKDVVIDVNVKNSFLSASDGVFQRVFITTGLLVSYWFELIPDKIEFAHGCGYRFMAPILGCNFDDYNYDRIIYDQTHPREVNEGLKGTATVANFMYDYANFGIWGLFFSAIVIAILLVVTHLIFKYNFTWLVTFNVLFVFWLSSTALSTLIFSGGWLPTIILFLLFRRAFVNDI